MLPPTDWTGVDHYLGEFQKLLAQVDRTQVQKMVDIVTEAYILEKTVFKGPLGRTYPVADAAEAIVGGIEGRSRWVVAPGWVKGAIYARGLLQPLLEAGARKDAAEADRIDREEVARLGATAASAPVGDGGAAAMAARLARGGAG